MPANPPSPTARRPQVCSIRGVNAGASPAGWLHKAVRSLELSVVFAGAANLTLMTDMHIQAIGMSFDSARPTADPTSDSTVTVKLNMPWSFPQTVLNTSMTLQLRSLGGSLLGVSDVPMVPVAHDLATNVLTISSSSPMHIVDSDAFALLLSSLMIQDSVTLLVTGLANPVSSSAAGVMQLTNIPFHQLVTLRGMSNLQHPPAAVSALDMHDASANTMAMSSSVQLSNPSSISASMGRISLELVYKGVAMAVVTIADFRIVPGQNAFTVAGVYTRPSPENEPLSAEFLSNYIDGVACDVVIRGFAGSSDIPVVAAAMASFSSPTSLPGQTDHLLAGGTMDLTHWSILSFYDIPTSLKIVNTFSIPVHIVASDCAVIACKTMNPSGNSCDEWSSGEVGRWTPDTISTTDPAKMIVVPPHTPPAQPYSAPEYTSKMNGISWDSLVVFVNSLKAGGALIKVDGQLTVMINGEAGYRQSLHFVETNVPIVLKVVNPKP